MSKLNRIAFAVLTAIGITAPSLVGCASTDPVVKVGLVGPFEGRYREVGYDVIYSARLAVREVNAAGGIGGYRVALVALDDSGNTQLAAAAASSLAIDADVVAVIGHWLEPTTAAAAPIYADSGLPLIEGGKPPFGRTDPSGLPKDFLTAYQSVTPFDEEAGPYAGPAYDAFQLLWLALADVGKSGQIVDRNAVTAALSRLSEDG